MFTPNDYGKDVCSNNEFATRTFGKGLEGGILRLQQNNAQTLNYPPA